VAISEATCWTEIRGAAAGRENDRDAFVRRYETVIRAYLAARWRGSPLVGEIDDGAQEVFVECFNGALGRADPDRPFRAFLFGVIKNVARRVEHARARAGLPLHSSFELPAREKSLSGVFDRAWAKALVQQAARLQRDRAKGDERATKRVEILRLRFQENLPIRAIAERWGDDPARLHHQYAAAREEFRAALGEVVAEHQPGDPGEVERECRRLIAFF